MAGRSLAVPPLFTSGISSAPKFRLSAVARRERTQLLNFRYWRATTFGIAVNLPFHFIATFLMGAIAVRFILRQSTSAYPYR